MASKGAASRAAARKQKDKWRAKRWYNIRAPRQPWHFKLIGETIGEEDELLIGRMYEIIQQELDGDFSKMNVKLKFRVKEIVGQDAITEFAGHEVLKDHVRRQVRRYRGKVDDVIDAVTEDGYYVRIKPFLITQGRVKTSQKQGMREACRNVVLQTAARNTWVALQKMILSGDLETEIEQAVRKVSTVRTVIIRKSQLVQDGVDSEDGPTLDEIREEESRVAAAKAAALDAAMSEDGGDEEESETPDVLAAAEAAADDDSEEAVEEDETEDDSEESAEEEPESATEDESPEEEAPDYSSMKVAELKELLKAAGKPVSGKKDELIARLQE
ncbi:MAG: SAP domain-containing protein [Candidatus Thermoplasmatota archaeon]|nr:SAP domain-containing protein [Candidatus Thermoplasmatota archaeon]